MAEFSYKLQIGEYRSTEDVYVSIELTVKDGVDKDDYETIRNALNKVEETVRKYQGVPNVT